MGGCDFFAMAISCSSVLIAATILSFAHAQTCDSTLNGWPNTNRPAYCCPYAGDGTGVTNVTRKCRKIEPYKDGYGAGAAPWYIEDLPTTTTPNPCYWSNLAGQTPDTQSQWNAPAKNFFVTIGPNSKPSSANTQHVLPTSGSLAPAYYAQVRDPDTNYNPGYRECAVAQEYYEAFNTALKRYNCEEQYSHWNCDDCRKAYARWAVAMALPACALTSADTESGASCTAIKPCVRICNEVVQKCPVTLGFTCPTDNRDYSTSDYCTTLNAAQTSFSTGTFTSPTSSPTTQLMTAASSQSLTFKTDCCNPMGLQNSAFGCGASFSLSLLCALTAWKLH